MVRFGKYPKKSVEELGREAAISALRHAGMGHREVEACYCGNVFNPPNVGQRIMDEIGISGVPVFNHENACGSSAAAFYDAQLAVKNGVFEKVLVVGVENMTSRMRGLIYEEGMSLQTDLGLVMPSAFALLGMKHMAEYGTSPEQFARISVKNHHHGAFNPFAQYQKEVSLDEVLSSPMISDPITLLQCTPIGDGAAAVVLSSGKIAKRYASIPVEIKSSALVSGQYKGNKGDLTGIEACARAAREAYEAASMSPEDLDVIELHDCFSIHELLAYEGLGLCEKGEGGSLVDRGVTEIGGKIPVNPSGGLLSKGHPLGATGAAQIVEIIWQLRGEADMRQVEGARVGLTHNGGGLGPGLEPGILSINIFAR